MQLNTYISQTILQVMNALKDTDTALKENDLGCIWTGDFSTHAEHLVKIRLVKGKMDDKPSVPVILFDYDVNMTVQDQNGSADNAKLSVGAKILQVMNFTGEVEGSSKKDHSEKEVQNLKCTIPVSMKKFD